jgi:dihydroorotase
VTYDTNLKVNLPLRTRKDTDALMVGVLDGTVDCIATHHQPHEWDSKTCEFEYARSGMIGLETCFGVLGKLGVSSQRIIELISEAPRRIFDLPKASIDKGNIADLTLFQPDLEYVFTENMIRSKSKNTAFTGHTLKGRAVGVVSKDGLYLNS